MSISKKIRFEVFKRDGFQCAYCGKTPPEVVLEIDHIDPKSGGGKDNIENLITACFDCNRGKRDIPLTIAPTQLCENLEVLKLKEEQLKEYRKFIKKVENRISKDIDELEDIFEHYFPGFGFADEFKAVSLKRFYASLPHHVLVDAMNRACAKFSHVGHVRSRSDAIKYFCGICWRRIRGES